MNVNYDEAIGLEGFEDCEGIELNAQELKGIVSPLGVIAFCNLVAPGGAPGYEPKYGIDLLVPKGSDDAAILFAAAKHIVTTKWGANSDREYDIAGQIASGFTGRQLNFNVLDGDLCDPEWNGGCWVVKAKHPDPVLILDANGRAVTDRNAFPGRNWGVRAVIELWAQPTKDRLNLRLLAVQGIQAGVRKTGRTQDQTAALVAGALAQLPALPANAFGGGAQAAQAAPRQAIAAAPAAAPAPRRSPAQAQPAPAPAAAPAPSRRRAAPAEPNPPVEAEVVQPQTRQAPGSRRRAAPAQDPSQFFREPAQADEGEAEPEAQAEQPAPPRRRKVAVS